MVDAAMAAVDSSTIVQRTVTSAMPRCDPKRLLCARTSKDDRPPSSDFTRDRQQYCLPKPAIADLMWPSPFEGRAARGHLRVTDRLGVRFGFDGLNHEMFHGESLCAARFGSDLSPGVAVRHLPSASSCAQVLGASA